MSRNYFDNELVQGWIEEYLEHFKKYEEKKDRALAIEVEKRGYTPSKTRKFRAFQKEFEKNFYVKTIPDDVQFRMDVLKDKIFKEVSKIINGIIFTHKFTVWDAYDDLFQEAAEACIKALPKFNSEFITSNGTKATAFNYFSLTAKNCLKFYTIRNQKNRNHLQIEEFHHISDNRSSHETTADLISSDFILQLRAVFKDKSLKKYRLLVDILEEYLMKTGEFNKRDFFRFAKSYGWSPNLIRKFLKIIKEDREKFYANVSEE